MDFNTILDFEYQKTEEPYFVIQIRIVQLVSNRTFCSNESFRNSEWVCSPALAHLFLRLYM